MSAAVPADDADSSRSPELAAYSLLCSTLLSYDAAMTIR